MPKINIYNTDCMEIPLVMKGVKGFQKGHHSQTWLGKKHTPETKRKMRLARLKNQPMHNPEVVARRSQTLKDRKTFAKENSNNWKGGVTPAHLLERTTEDYLKWRDDVFIRDNYTCQHCHTRCEKGVNVVLHAHHIKKFSQYPELRLDVNNGITLCRDCHKVEHKNGTKN